MPELDDDETDPYDIEMIMAVMKEERLNILKWMVSLMQANRQDKDSPLIFQPYIMALVLLKLPTLHTAMYEEHRQYRVNNLDREVLLREPSPFAYVPPTIPEGLSLFHCPICFMARVAFVLTQLYILIIC